MTVHAVTPNPALDVTYVLTAPLAVHGVNRIAAVASRPGGKGVNVARLAAAHGATVAAHGFLGEPTGTLIRDGLTDLAPAIEQRWTPAEADTRRTIAVVDGADTTMLNESGGAVDDADWDRLTATLTGAVAPGDVVTISGSLPPGGTPELLAALVRAAREAGAVVVADTSGPALLAAADAGADLLKPNRDELVEALGLTGPEDVEAGVAELLRRGAGAVLISLGADGMRLVTPTGSRRASLDAPVTGNPTGAGDAVVAALAVALDADPDPARRDAVLAAALTRAVAWGAAAVLAPVAGEIDAATATDLETRVRITED